MMRWMTKVLFQLIHAKFIKRMLLKFTKRCYQDKGGLFMYINGNWINTKKQLDIKNPATGGVVGQVGLVGKEETDKAIEAANSALPQWSNLTSEQRALYLEKVVDKLKEKKEYLAQIITKEMGKSIHSARYEVNSTIGFFKWYAEEARRVYGDIIPSSAQNKRISVIRQPVGVVAAITPWNFPLSMLSRKLGPALAVGCTIIIKPSSEAPLTAVELFKIFDQVGIPKGVVNLLIGKSNEIAEPLMKSKVIRKISFTGSTEVGKLLIRQSADTVKKVSMELGGHAPFIVFEDADIDLAVEGMINSKFASTGQQCVCANRIYVHDSIYEEFSKRSLEKIEKLTVGNGLDEENQIGSMTNENGIKKVESQIEDAVKKGAQLIYGGHRLSDGELANGYFYSPTLLVDVKDDMEVCFEET